MKRISPVYKVTLGEVVAETKCGKIIKARMYSILGKAIIIDMPVTYALKIDKNYLFSDDIQFLLDKLIDSTKQM